MAKSYWDIISPGVSYPALEHDIRPGVAVVGGGITGLTAALLLAERGVDVALLEARRVGSGTSGYSTGKVTVQNDDVYGKLMNRSGASAAKGYLLEAQRGFDFVKARHDALAVPYDILPNVVFAATDGGRARLRADSEAGRAIGLDMVSVDKIGINVKCESALMTHGQMSINPKAYCNALAAAVVKSGGKIYERTAVAQIKEGKTVRLVTRDGKSVTAGAVVQAVGYPIYPRVGVHLLRLRPVRAHLMAFRLKSDMPGGMYISLDKRMPTLRGHSHMGDNALVIGGLSHRAGQTSGGIYGGIEAYARERFDLGEALAVWGAEDYETPDGMPYVGSGGPHKNIYTAVGFNKWGLTGGTAAAIAIAGAVTGGGFGEDYPFKPSRIADIFTRAAVSHMCESTAHYFSDRFGLSATLPKRAGEGKIVMVGGRRGGAYRSESGELFVVSAICPHLGCPLSFNAAEKSWDCPCHGSRFAPDGRAIHGPSTKGLKRFKKLYL